MEHSKVEEEDDDEAFPTFGDSQSDYDTVSQPYTKLAFLETKQEIILHH